MLFPQRLDVLSRAMASGMFTMWLQMQHVCDVVFWGPGFTGWEPVALDEASRRFDCDAVLLPDLHHAIAGLWDDLWVGADRCDVPVIMFLSDPGSAVGPRIDAIRKNRPELLMILGSEESYAAYRGVCEEIGCRMVSRPLGYDPALFYDNDGVERDIDILVAGAADADAYVVRRRVQRACRRLSDRWRVMDLTHPGYWEISRRSLFNTRRTVSPAVVRAWARLFFAGGITLRETWRRWSAHRDTARQRAAYRSRLIPAPERHGQATYAELMRRAKLVTTGTTYGIIAEKYYEAIASSAIGIGDLPEQPGSALLDPAMIVVGPGDDEAQIMRAVDAVLRDEMRQERMRMAAAGLAEDMTHTARAAETVATISAAIGYRERPHAPLTFQQVRFDEEVFAVLLRAAPDQPQVRRGWHEIADGGSAVDELRRLLEVDDHPYIAFALSPDAILPPDVHLLVEAARQHPPRVAVRPAEPSVAGAASVDELLVSGWTLAVTARNAVIRHLEDHQGGLASVAAALLRTAEECGVQMHEGPGFDEPAAAALRGRAATEFVESRRLGRPHQKIAAMS